EAQRIITAIRAALCVEGRTIDNDHYGASFPYFLGSPSDPSPQRAIAAYRRRTGRDADGYFAIGDANAILERIAAYVAAGGSKFILRPLGRDDGQILAQPRRLIAEVLPALAARWPRGGTAQSQA